MKLKKERRQSKNKNTYFADINEIYLAFLLCQKDWKKFSNSKLAKEVLLSRLMQIASEVPVRGVALTQEAIERSEKMAEKVLDWVSEKCYAQSEVDTVWWTARPGILSKVAGLEIASKENPTDVLIKFKDSKLLGISAKATKGKMDIGFKNPGLGALSKSLKHDFSSLVTGPERRVCNELALPFSKKQRKRYIRERRDVQQKTIKVGEGILEKLRDRLLTLYTESTQSWLKEHFLSFWLDAKNNPPKYIKVTGHGAGRSCFASLEDPGNNKKLEALSSKEISFIKLGNNSIGVLVGDLRIMKVRFKYESEKVASTVKLSGDPWKN